MASYFDEEDATYNSDDTKSVNSDEDKIYPTQKGGGGLKDSLKSKKQHDLNINTTNDEIEEADEDEDLEDDLEDEDDDDLGEDEEPFEQEGGADTKKKNKYTIV